MVWVCKYSIYIYIHRDLICDSSDEIPYIKPKVLRMLCPTLVPLDDVATKEGTAWFIPAESESQSNRVERSASWHLMMLI